MRNSFPIVLCIIGAIADFIVWVWLRSFKVRDKPPKSLSHLSVEERQRKIRIAGWVMFASAWVFVAGAAVLYWLGNRR